MYFENTRFFFKHLSPLSTQRKIKTLLFWNPDIFFLCLKKQSVLYFQNTHSIFYELHFLVKKFWGRRAILWAPNLALILINNMLLYLDYHNYKFGCQSYNLSVMHGVSSVDQHWRGGPHPHEVLQVLLVI